MSLQVPDQPRQQRHSKRGDLTPQVTENELKGSIGVSLPVVTVGDCYCGNDDGTRVVGDSDRRQFRPEHELEHVHRDKHLIQDKKYCALVKVWPW